MTMESFLATLEIDWIHQRHDLTLASASNDIIEYIALTLSQ